MRRLIIGAAAASVLAVPVAAQAHGNGSHATHKPVFKSTRQACATLHTHRFTAAGRVVGFTPSTAAGASATDGALTVLVRRAPRGASRRYLGSLAKPWRWERKATFTLSAATVTFRPKTATSFTTLPRREWARLFGQVTGPARGCKGAWTLSVQRVVVHRAPRTARTHATHSAKRV